MTIEMQKNDLETFGRLAGVILSWPWLETLAASWKFTRKLWRGMADEGIYEVLEHVTTLELLDKRGHKANVFKHQKVRYLQNDVASYLDQAWGDGEFLIDYKCSPGKEVDRYIEEHKTYILVSLQGIRKRGDEDSIDIEWQFRDGFLTPIGQWSSEVSHRTKRFSIRVIFPQNRPPIRVWRNKYLQKSNQPLDQKELRKLPDGRWLASWNIKKPRLFERYSLKWEW